MTGGPFDNQETRGGSDLLVVTGIARFVPILWQIYLRICFGMGRGDSDLLVVTGIEKNLQIFWKSIYQYLWYGGGSDFLVVAGIARFVPILWQIYLQKCLLCDKATVFANIIIVRGEGYEMIIKSKHIFLYNLSLQISFFAFLYLQLWTISMHFLANHFML